MNARAARDMPAGAGLARGVLGLITARGGSKGLPGKNMAALGGKPLIAWTVEKALGSGAIERLIVSTDDPAIADAARRAGAEVPFVRPAELARDDTPHLPVIQHALEHERASGYDAAYLVLLQPTSPLVAADDIATCVELAKSRSAAAVISVVRFHGHPSWIMRVDTEGRLAPWQPTQPTAERRQDGAAAFLPNGAVYVLAADLVRRGEGWYGPSTLAYEMPAERSLDIDDVWDLRLARLIFEHCQ
jgi:CMP-N-acetylneuraminic acid synthetase